MKRLALALFIAITMGHGTITYAQDSLIGTYTGTYTGGPFVFGVKLVIVSVENGVAKGTATVFDGACAGSYANMEGTYDDNKLAMKDTSKGDHASFCIFGFEATHEGIKLVGKIGNGWPIQMSK